MSINDPTYKATLEARLETKQAQLALTATALEELITQNIEEYRLNSGEMAQGARRRKVNELRDLQSTLEAEIDSLYRRINGGGITSINMRRKR